MVLAALIAPLQAICGFYGASYRRPVYIRVAERAALLQFLMILYSFAVLMSRFIVSDFSVALVAQGSRYDLPLLYRFTAVWGNHEGSMLLWVLILAAFGAIFVLTSKKLAPILRARIIAIQGLISIGFYGFSLLTSNPFTRLALAPIEGQGLNPILLDPGLAFHPPLLYIGYVGFSMGFSFALAGLIAGEIDAAWARWVRPWILVAWVFLTLGICLGSWWAYYTLGWGGWWFWDPVENAALMPWLLGTALLHTLLVVEKRESLKRWALLLAILTFGLSLMGTFLVRSGVLTSVHAFATDPERGLYILLLLTVTLGGGLLLYALRAPLLRAGGIFAPISRETALVVNNIGLSSAAVAVAVGTLYPVLLDIIGSTPVSVGPPYFMITFVPIMTPLLIALGIGPMLAWKKADLWAALERLWVAALGLVLVIILVYSLVEHVPALAIFGIGLSVWIGLATLSEFSERVGLFHIPIGTLLRRMRFLPYSSWGKTIAHLGMAVSILGMASSAFRQETILVMSPHQALAIGPFTLQLEGLSRKTGGGYSADVADFTVLRQKNIVTRLQAERRVFDDSAMVTNVTAIAYTGLTNLYVALGNPVTADSIAKNSKSNDNAGNSLKTALGLDYSNEKLAPSYVVRVYWTPLEPFIWFGAIMMALGGIFALLDRTSHQRQVRLWVKMGIDGSERRPL